MNKYIPITNDKVFKYIFGNPKYLTMLYEAMFKQKVEELQMLGSIELPLENFDNKACTLDVLTIINGEYVHIEMQVKKEKHILSRVFAYCSKILSMGIKRADQYQNIPHIKTILISLENLYNDNVCVDRITGMYDVRKIEVESQLQEIYIVELGKIMEDQFKTLDIKNEFNQIMYAIGVKSDDDKCLRKIRKLNKGVDDMIKDTIRFTQEDIEELQQFMKDEARLYQNTLLAEAKEEAMEEGIRRGRKEGKEEGVEENQIKIICKLYKQNTTVQFISTIVDLSEDEVSKILRKNKLLK